MNKSTSVKISKSELISTFSDIDVKINDLHERSSSDFIQLNNYLKDYHKKTRIISENAFRIFETVSGEKDMDLIKELGKIHYRLEECIGNINQEDEQKVQDLKEIILKSNQLNITIRNLRQDFTTFKFLSTNYCLIANYEDLDRDRRKKFEVWNTEIQSIQQLLLSLSSHIDSFKEQIAASIGYIELRVEKSLDVFQNLSKETKSNIGSVVLKSLESKLQFPLLKEKSADSSKSINDIITHLQYHDIIRQKIEHIQKSHYKIIDDLNKSIQTKNFIEDCLPEDYIKIGDIIDLQAAQLLLVSKEYQNALNVITKNFLRIAKDMTAISGISDKFSFKDSNSQITLLKQIKDQLDKGIILLDLHNFNEINTEYNEAGKKLDVITDQIKNNIQPSLTRFTSLNSTENNDLHDKVNGSGVLSQIVSLTRDIEAKNHDIIEKLIEIRNLSEKMFALNELESWENQLEMDRLHIMVNISRILDTLDKDNEELDNVLIQNRDLNNYILEKIESTITGSDYYEYFEKIVEQVIALLNGINNKIRPANTEESSDTKADNLREIKTTYTMESERIIHDNVVSGCGGSDTLPVQSADNEVEFF
jgi:hypothetical protein